MENKYKLADVICLQQGDEAYGRNTNINFNNIYIILFVNRSNYHYVCLNYCISSNY